MVVEFSCGGVQNWKDFCLKNQHTPQKLLNFENWYNGEVSKIGHHSRKQSDLKIDAIKNANKKKCAPKLIKASTI